MKKLLIFIFFSVLFSIGTFVSVSCVDQTSQTGPYAGFLAIEQAYTATVGACWTANPDPTTLPTACPY